MEEFSLKSICNSKKKDAARVIIYGTSGVGKTTFASMFPNPILLRIEDGAGEIDVPTFPQLLTNLQQLDNVIMQLVNEKHDFETLVIDSLDWLEPIVWQYLCESNNRKNIEEFGYGKGYILAAEIWRRIFAKLDNLKRVGLNTVLIAHSLPVKFDPPDSDGYLRYDLKLHSKAAELAKEWADSIYFLQYQVQVQSADPTKLGSKGKASGDGSRIIYTAERPAYIAKSRKNLPPYYPIETIGDYAEFIKLALN